MVFCLTEKLDKESYYPHCYGQFYGETIILKNQPNEYRKKPKQQKNPSYPSNPALKPVGNREEWELLSRLPLLALD